MPQADVILKGLEPYGAVALVALGFGLGVVIVVLRMIQARREVRLARIAAQKDLRLAELQQKARP